MAEEKKKIPRGVVVEFDFTVVDGAQLLFDTAKKVLAESGIDLTVKLEAMHLAGGNYHGAVAELFDVVLGKRDGAGDVSRALAKAFADALTENTAKLPRFELVKPEGVIGRNTVANMQAGIIYGYIGQIKYLVNRMKREMGVEGIKVIATGGLAVLVAGESSVIDVMDGLLTLKGLCLIYARNTAR